MNSRRTKINSQWVSFSQTGFRRFCIFYQTFIFFRTKTVVFHLYYYRVLLGGIMQVKIVIELNEVRHNRLEQYKMILYINY